MPITAVMTAEVGVQTDRSIPHMKTKSEVCGDEWLFFEPRKTIEHSRRAAELLNQTAIKRLRRFPPLRQADRAALIETMCNCTASEAEGKLMHSPLRSSILLEVLYDIENNARENSTRSSVLNGNSYGDLCSFNWNDILEDLLTQQPFLAEVLLAVILPTSKIGHSKATNSLVPVIGAVYGILMKQHFHELSLVQKVLSETLANEQTHQKVNRVTVETCSLFNFSLFMLLLLFIRTFKNIYNFHNVFLNCKGHLHRSFLSKRLRIVLKLFCLFYV